MSFQQTMADNVAELLKWHQKRHLESAWTACPHEPCHVLDPDFRRNWSE